MSDQRGEEGANRRLKCLIACSLVAAVFASSIGASPPDSPEGIWAWNDSWAIAPAELDLDSEMATASALITNFCPHGEFRMASGSFYRSKESIELGSSDGIATYRGTWEASRGELVVRYRLASAELIASGESFDRERATEQIVEPVLVHGSLVFPHRRWHWGSRAETVRAYRMEPAGSYDRRLGDRFVECAAVTEKVGAD